MLTSLPAKSLPLLLFAATAFAQQQESDPIPTLRANAKLVLVDVVVTGQNHAPLQGLKQSDFTLLEDKKPQPIKGFEEHRALTAQEALEIPGLPPMPRGVFTNYTPTPVNSAVNVLLLDTLNTPLQDQLYVRNQLREYVKKAQPGTSVAIFSLTTTLHMLQGFTSDPEILKTAIGKVDSTSSPLLTDPSGAGATETVSDQIADLGNPSTDAIAAGLANLEANYSAIQQQIRLQDTLDALTTLARFLANIPGRKNLIWFSGAFPLNILPDSDAQDPFRNVAINEEQYRETANSLARSQVAVYPIDARGLQTDPTFSAAQANAKYARNPSAQLKDHNKFIQQNTREHFTMQQMAEDTGGEAFINNNDLTKGVNNAISQGSNYYTIAYTPTDDKWNGNFRKIEVKLLREGYKLDYRRGYYSDDPDKPKTELKAAIAPAPKSPSGKATGRPDAMHQAMIHGLPGASQIVYKVRVLPASTASEQTTALGNIVDSPGFAHAKGPYHRYAIDFAALPSGIQFTKNDDGRYHASIEFVSLVYGYDGLAIVSQSDTLDIALPPDRYTRLQQGGLNFHQVISVPDKGGYSIRTGIHDLRSDAIGNLEVNVSTVKNLPPPAPQPLQPRTPPAAPGAAAPPQP